MHLRLFAPSLLVATLAAVPATASEDLARKLVRLRAEVEALSEELELKRQTEREQLAGLAQRRAELESERQREDLRLRRLEQALEDHAAEVADIAARDATLKPAVLQAGAELRAHIASGLPFKTEERLSAVDDIVAATERDELPASRAAARLWSLIQDERRLTGESAMHRQVVPLAGGEALADTVRIGMVLLYFATPDGRYGQAVKGKGGWRFELETDRARKQEIAALFGAFEKRVRGGWFDVPVALPKEAR